MPNKVFISYCSADQETADKLVAEIERRGIPCWISSRDIRPGEDYQRAIVTALRDAAVYLLLFSENANKSSEIPRELALAGKYKKTVIPARVQDIVPSEAFAYQMTSAQFIDLFRDFDTKVNELCQRLAELLEISETVKEKIRLEEEQRLRANQRAALKRKLKSVAVGVIVLALAVGGTLAYLRLGKSSRSSSASQDQLANSAPPVQPPPVVAASAAAVAPSSASAQPSTAGPGSSAAPVASPPPAGPVISSPDAPPAAVQTMAPQVTIAAPPVTAAPAVAAMSAPAAAVAPQPAQSIAQGPAPAIPYFLSSDSTQKYAQATRDALLKIAPPAPFAPGKYVNSNNEVYTICGPGVSLPGQTSWSICLDQGAGVHRTYWATWTTGPASQNPDLANQKHLSSLPEGYSFGTEGGGVIGVRVVAGAIEITRFAYDGGWKSGDKLTVSAQVAP